MKKILILSSIIFTVLIILFFIAETLHIPFLSDKSITKTAGVSLCCLGVLLLSVDVLIPVPSSLVMITLGSSLGIFWGTFWSFIGVMGAAIFGFFIGRSAQPLIRHFITEKERERTNAFINRWGTIGIIMTRPMPLFAETTVLIAGTTGLSWKKLLAGSVAGNLPIALLYAWTGATAQNINSGIRAFLFAIGVAGVLFLINYLLVASKRYPSKDTKPK